jgi:hypothetical protein
MMMSSFVADYEEAARADKATPNSTAYVVEKEWFDNFLAYKDKIGTEDAANSKPGDINNEKLLLSSKEMNGGTSSLESMSEKIDADNNNSESDERQLRRRRWQGIKERNKEQQEEKKGDELLGGNAAQFRPELREGVDYVLVGKQTWSFLSSNFQFDVDLPHQQQPLTASLDSTKMSNSASDSKLSEMDAEDAGSSVAVAPSASSLISEGSSKSESGDDLVSLFPSGYE